MRADRVALLLPEVIRRGAGPGTPLGALLDVMEAMHEPAEAALLGLPAMLDPQATRDDFVPFLASWVGLDDVIPDGAEFEAGTGRLRQLVATAAARARRRGTLDGLRETLAIATGRRDITVDDTTTGPDGGMLPFHVDVVVPDDAVGLLDLVTRLVEHEKPAFVTASVILAPGTDTVPAAAPTGPAESAITPPTGPPPTPVAAPAGAPVAPAGAPVTAGTPAAAPPVPTGESS